MQKIAVERTIWINAPRKRVWQVITDPAQIQQWFSPPTPWKLTELSVGGKLYAVGYESQNGIIEVIESPRQFSYRWQWPDANNPLPMMTTYTLEDENGGTRVTLTEHVLSEDTRQKDSVDSGNGWRMALDNLKAYLEGKALPFPEGL